MAGQMIEGALTEPRANQRLLRVLLRRWVAFVLAA